MAGEFGALQSENNLMKMCQLSRQLCSKLNKAADAADAHVSVGKMEMISRAAVKMTNSAAAGKLTGDEI